MNEKIAVIGSNSFSGAHFVDHALGRGAEVIGISADDEASHREFAAQHKLPFILLSDPGRKVAKLYGVGNTMGFLPGRVTFVIDKEGIIRGRYSSQVNYDKHVEEALEVLKELK